MQEGPPVGSPTIGSNDPSTIETPAWQPPKSRVDRAAEQAALAYVRRGDHAEALNILMDTYGDPVMAFAIRTVRNRELAKDIRQQVFLEAFQGFDGFAARSTLWSWLCGIAYHRCLDELRRLRRASAADDLAALDDLAVAPDLTMEVDRATKRRALEQCLGTLSVPTRTQLLMRCLLGLSHTEIGEIVGAPHSTVQVRISRALPRLRQCLRGEGLAR